MTPISFTFSSFDALDTLVKSGKLLHPPWFITKKPMNITVDIHLSELRDVDPERLVCMILTFSLTTKGTANDDDFDIYYLM